MQMPEEPCLADDEDPGAGLPAVKRARTGAYVEQVVLQQDLRAVPPQTVLH